MKKEFDPNNSHDQNVKVAIDKILGEETSLRKIKKSQEDHKRIMFCRIIEAITAAEERSISMDEIFEMDMTKYNQPFFDIITDFLSLTFSKKQINLINFYLYDRYCADGTVLELTDDNENLVPLETPTDLWYLLNKIGQ